MSQLCLEEIPKAKHHIQYCGYDATSLQTYLYSYSCLIVLKVLPIFIATVIVLGLSGAVYAEGIPVWVKSIAGFWADDQISDDEYAASIQYLVEQDIISVEAKPAEQVPAQVTSMSKFTCDDYFRAEMQSTALRMVSEGLVGDSENTELTKETLIDLSKETIADAKDSLKRVNPSLVCLYDEYTDDQTDVVNMLDNIKTPTYRTGSMLSSSSNVIGDFVIEVDERHLDKDTRAENNHQSTVKVTLANDTGNIVTLEIWIVQEGKAVTAYMSCDPNSDIRCSAEQITCLDDEIICTGDIVYSGTALEGVLNLNYDDLDTREDFSVNVRDQSCSDDCPVYSIEINR